MSQKPIVDLVVRLDVEETPRLTRAAEEGKCSAASEDGKPVAEVEAASGVGDDDHGSFARVRKLPKQAHHLRFQPRVESGGRFVETEQARSIEQFGSNAGSFALSARQQPDALRRMLLERELDQDTLDRCVALALLGVRRQAQPRRVAEGLAHGQSRVHDLVLRYVADVGQAGGHRLPVQCHGA